MPTSNNIGNNLLHAIRRRNNNNNYYYFFLLLRRIYYCSITVHSLYSMIQKRQQNDP